MDETTIPKQWHEWWAERAAIMHWDGGLDVETAEQEALVCLREHVAAFQERRRKKAGRPVGHE